MVGCVVLISCEHLSLNRSVEFPRCLLRCGTDSVNDPAPRQFIRYQLGNHLGSAILELDDEAQIISYEEYYPYGSTS